VRSSCDAEAEGAAAARATSPNIRKSRKRDISQPPLGGSPRRVQASSGGQVAPSKRLDECTARWHWLGNRGGSPATTRRAALPPGWSPRGNPTRGGRRRTGCNADCTAPTLVAPVRPDVLHREAPVASLLPRQEGLSAPGVPDRVEAADDLLVTPIIAYSDSPTASRASPSVWNTCRRTILPTRKVTTWCTRI
jgi:hypothetical protein